MGKSPFLTSIRDYMLVRRYSKRTIDSYLAWIKAFILFHNKRHPKEMGDHEVEIFLTRLAVNRKRFRIHPIVGLERTGVFI